MYFTFNFSRLSEQAQKQLEVNGKFEDISLGTNRPSQIIQRYEELFTQGRMDALDFMEGQNLDTQFSENFLLEALQVGIMIELIRHVVRLGDRNFF